MDQSGQSQTLSNESEEEDYGYGRSKCEGNAKRGMMMKGGTVVQLTAARKKRLRRWNSLENKVEGDNKR